MYTEDQDFYDAFGQPEIDQLCDRDGDGQPDAGVLTAIHTRVASMFDGYFRTAGLAVPLNPVPESVKGYALDVGRYLLFTNDPPQVAIDNYNAALAWLENVSNGLVSLGSPEPDEVSSTVQFASAGNVFGRRAHDAGACE